MLLCLDTVGKYKGIKPADIDTAKIIGDKLISVFELFETRQFEGQGVYLDGAKDFGPEKIAEFMAPIAEEEAAALAAVAEELAPPEAAEGDDAEPAPAVAETLKAFKEACAVLNVNTNAVGNEETFGSLVPGISGHVLPPSAAVVNLIYTLALLTGCNNDAKDLYGEITWINLINKCVPNLASGIASFNAENFDVTETKTFVEANGVLPGEYPPSCAVCTALSQWATKAIGAADGSAAHKAFLAEQEAAANAVEEE